MRELSALGNDVPQTDVLNLTHAAPDAYEIKRLFQVAGVVALPDETLAPTFALN